MREMSFEEMERRNRGRTLTIATQFTRENKVRRKPRSVEESNLIGEIISRRVQQAREAGDLIVTESERIIRF